VNSQARIRVFIGSGEASRIERNTAIYSLRKNSKRELDIYVFNGTHNSVQLNGGEPFLAPMSLKVKYQNITEFSLYRFLIPELCNYQGRAIYIDSDTVCLSDIGELFETPMGDTDFLSRRDTNPDEVLWGLSVMLIDCHRCRFDLERIVDEIEADPRIQDADGARQPVCLDVGGDARILVNLPAEVHLGELRVKADVVELLRVRALNGDGSARPDADGDRREFTGRRRWRRSR